MYFKSGIHAFLRDSKDVHLQYFSLKFESDNIYTFK